MKANSWETIGRLVTLKKLDLLADRYKGRFRDSPLPFFKDFMIDWNLLLFVGAYACVVTFLAYLIIKFSDLKAYRPFRHNLRLEAKTDIEGVILVYDTRVASVPVVAVDREYLHSKGRILAEVAELEAKFGPFEDQDGMKGLFSYFDDRIHFKPDPWKGFKPVRVR